MRIEVVHATPALQKVVLLELDSGATARQAALLSGLDHYFSQLDLGSVPLGVFGQKVRDDQVLQAGDRVELYRELIVDPMEARRRRARSD